MNQQQDQLEKAKKALVVYADSDDSFSKYLVSYLSGAGLEGVVFSRRVDRYGCILSFYDLVVVLNDAEIDEKNHPHVWEISVDSYSQVKSTTYLTGYTFQEYLRDKAKDTAEKVVKKLTGGRF